MTQLREINTHNCTVDLASFPGPAQLSIACSAEKLERVAHRESLGTRLM